YIATDVVPSLYFVPFFPPLQLQRFKRSLSLKTILRSKSVENFFLRSNSEFKLPTDVLLSPPDSVPPPSPPPVPTEAERSPRALQRSLAPLKPMKTHSFQEHIFKKHNPCEICHQLIVGNSKQGLRCKTCKVSVHLWCSEEVSHQQCPGKAQATSFRRNLSSPMLLHDTQPQPVTTTTTTTTTASTIATAATPPKESPPAAGPSGKVDPIYETLRYGTSLAYMNRSSFSSTSESPTRSLNEKDEGAEDTEAAGQPAEELQADNVFSEPAENEGTTSEEKSPEQQVKNIPLSTKMWGGDKHEMTADEPFDYIPAQLAVGNREDASCWWLMYILLGPRIVPRTEHVYIVPLLVSGDKSGFLSPYRPGDRIMLVDDSNEDWWKICVGVGKTKENEGFIKVTSGKKRGLVPADALTEI
ncbi:hypothetical protein JD844_002182, partial [Phrynosoma platyrhinos]